MCAINYDYLRSGERLTLKTSALESLCGGQLSLVINSADTPSIHFYPPTMQHSSFFRNLPSYPFGKITVMCDYKAENIRREIKPASDIATHGFLGKIIQCNHSEEQKETILAVKYE